MQRRIVIGGKHGTKQTGSDSCGDSGQPCQVAEARFTSQDYEFTEWAANGSDTVWLLAAPAMIDCCSCAS